MLNPAELQRTHLLDVTKKKTAVEGLTQASPCCLITQDLQIPSGKVYKDGHTHG